MDLVFKIYKYQYNLFTQNVEVILNISIYIMCTVQHGLQPLT